ncbi:hypothetical protein OOU_Y34scaffold00610g68 [Pyricularia oryzae Y34]|uniref:deuterolysin n=1 Tax=Pyricularia oryzae (strain Y34) TaxID=1143189 RepID=A0AA97PJR6_PYRO3|nr:hypothetical protein OOU_Y34scaffold00610g68 [Pyricularia oryzae Y34]
MFDIAQQPAQTPQVQIEPPSILQSYNPTLLKRATFDDTCTSDQKAAIGLAATNCATLAQYGSEAAKYDKEKVLLYFKTSNPRSIRTIVNTFDKAYYECSIYGGEGTITCRDDWRACSAGTMAHTIQSKKKITMCPLFFTLSATASYYGERSQANVLLHEVTHLRNVKGTDDYSSWGHAAVLELSESQNLNHADTYTFFAESARLRG